MLGLRQQRARREGIMPCVARAARFIFRVQPVNLVAMDDGRCSYCSAISIIRSWHRPCETLSSRLSACPPGSRLDSRLYPTRTIREHGGEMARRRVHPRCPRIRRRSSDADLSRRNGRGVPMRETDGASLPGSVDGHLGDRRYGDLPDWERCYCSAGDRWRATPLGIKMRGPARAKKSLGARVLLQP